MTVGKAKDDDRSKSGSHPLEVTARFLQQEKPARVGAVLSWRSFLESVG
jgi:hypothetical protein